MSTGRVHAGFFRKQILGAATIRDSMFEASRDYARDLGGKIIGEAVIDATLVGLGITASAAAINERKLTITGTNLAAINGSGDVFGECGSGSTLRTLVEGARTITLSDPAWFTSLPYENANGTTYRAYLAHTKFPIDVVQGSEGNRGYGRFVEAPGVSINPDAVTNAGTHLEFTVLTDLTALGIQPWLTANEEDDAWSYDCVVWLDTDVTGVEIATDDPDIAIAFTAKLTKRVGNPDWMVSLSSIGNGFLGQSTVDTDETHYRIAVLGPIITTTNLDTNPDYVHIGQIDSATGGETIVTSDQIIVEDISSQLTESVVVHSRLHKRGWFTQPTATTSVGDTQLDIATGGEIFIGGKAISVSSSSLNAFPGSSVVYVYYDNGVGVEDFDFTTTIDDAMLDPTRIPFMSFSTNGSSAIQLATIKYIGQTWLKFTDTLTLTVGSSAEHNAMFNTLEKALSYAAAMQSTSDDIRRVIIDVIGPLTVSASIDAILWGSTVLKNVTIRGAAQGGLTSPLTAGAVISWSFNSAPLIEATEDMEGWTFENLTFSYSGGTGAHAECVIQSNGGDVRGLTFRNCVFDGNTAAAPFGGAGGNLSHVIYDGGSSVPLTDVLFENCVIYTDGPAVYTDTGSAGDPIRLKMSRCSGRQSSVAALFGGGVLSFQHATTGAQDISIKDCSFIDLNGPLIDINGIDGLVVSGNRCNWAGGAALMIDISSSGQYGDYTVRDMKIHDNVFKLAGAAGLNIGLRVYADAAVGDLGLNVHDNSFEMDDSPGNGIGITVNGTGLTTSAYGASGLHIHNNTIRGVNIGMLVYEADMAHVHNNTIVAVNTGIHMSGSSGAATYPSLINAHNIIRLTGTASTTMRGIDYASVAQTEDRHISFGNIIDAKSATADVDEIKGFDLSNAVSVHAILAGNLVIETDVGFDLDTTESVMMGNLVMDGKTVSALGFRLEDNTYTSFIGNVCDPVAVSKAVSHVTATTPVDNSTFVGNIFRSASASELNLSGCTLVGNFLYDLDVGATATAIVGNQFNAVDAGDPGGLFGTGFTNVAFTGNELNSFNDGAGNLSVGFAGNNFRASSVTFEGSSYGMSGNVLGNGVVLAVSSSSIAFVGNEVKGASSLTNSGTGNLVQTATDGDPLNT